MTYQALRTRGARLLARAERSARNGARWAARAHRRLRAGEPTTEVSNPRASAPAPRAASARAERIRRLVASPLFDHHWYNSQTSANRARRTAAVHYLDRGSRQGLSPHPLFDDAFFRDVAGDQLPANRPALLAYLRKKSLRSLPTHPLFDVDDYLANNPAARKHPAGPLAHYVQFGAGEGLAPNSWYNPDPLTEPGGLADWIVARRAEWVLRRRQRPLGWRKRRDSMAEDFLANHPRLRPRVDHKSGRPLVSAIVRSGLDADILVKSLTSVAEQTVNAWEVVLLDEGYFEDVESVARRALGGGDLIIVPVDPDLLAEGWNVGTAHARGEFLAWLTSGEIWQPERVGRLTALAQQSEAHAAYDGVERHTQKRDTLFADGLMTVELLRNGAELELSRVIMSRTRATEMGFDDSLFGHAAGDFTLRLFLTNPPPVWVPVVGVRRDDDLVHKANRLSPRFRPQPDHEYVSHWYDVARNRRLVCWTDMESRVSKPGRVSVLIPTHDDWKMTTTAVDSVQASANVSGREVQVLVYDNGCPVQASVVLDSLAARWPNVQIVHSPVNHGFALGNNLALEHADGEFVVFLNNDTRVDHNWLRPLIARLENPKILGVQSLLTYPDGTIQSSGVAFPRCGGLPHEFLGHFPAEDAATVDALAFHALTGAALAMRRSELAVLRGFDPLFRNGYEDVDLCLRAARKFPGRSFRVVPTSRVTHFESRTAGRFAASLTNRQLYIDRWGSGSPGDDATLWAAQGFEVTTHRIEKVVADNRRICTPEPQLRRCAVTEVREEYPQLRWAIKNPAPAGAEGNGWGDTYFAEHLADGLRSLGQQVVIDRKEAFFRPTTYLDDVVVAIRGLTSYRPAFGQISFGWIISHPEMFSRAEAGMYDRLFAASPKWAKRVSQEWALRIDTLLQATDPELFNPDRAQPDTGHPAVFVGKSRMVMRPIVRQAIDAGLGVAVYGGEWKGFIDPGYVKAPSIPNHEVGALYRSAGVVLNDHWKDMREHGFISNRVFDAVASGARVISDDVEGVEELFGRSVFVVRDPADMARIAATNNLDEFFGDDDERRAVAERTAKEHSFVARAQRLLEAAVEMRGTHPA